MIMLNLIVFSCLLHAKKNELSHWCVLMHKNDELQFFLAEVLKYNAIAYKYNSVIYRQY